MNIKLRYRLPPGVALIEPIDPGDYNRRSSYRPSRPGRLPPGIALIEPVDLGDYHRA